MQVTLHGSAFLEDQNGVRSEYCGPVSLDAQGRVIVASQSLPEPNLSDVQSEDTQPLNDVVVATQPMNMGG